jgi:hypothetical protein
MWVFPFGTIGEINVTQDEIAAAHNAAGHGESPARRTLAR